MTDITTEPATTAARTRSERAVLRLIIAMALIEALSGVSQGYLNPILPALGGPLSITDDTINLIWLVSSLGFAVVTPIVSRLGDSFGYRRTLRWSVAVVSIGVLLMAIVPTLVTVMIGVVLLTVVVGFIPLMMGILRATDESRTRAGVGTMVGTLMLTVGGGGLLAGYVGQDDPLKAFWVAVPFAAIAILCAWLLPDAGTPDKTSIAVVPLATCSLGLIALVTATAQGAVWGWTDLKTVGCAVAGVVLLALWARLDSRQSRAGKHFVNLRMLAVPQIRTITIATFFFGFASISYLAANGIFLHSESADAGYGFGLDPLQIAELFIVSSVASFLASLATSWLMTVVSERGTLILSGVVLAAGFVVLLVAHGSFVGYVAGLVLFGLGLGAYQSATRALAVEGLPQDLTATAAGLNELALSLGIAIGASVVQMVIASNLTADGHIALRGFTLIWMILAAAALIAAAASTTYRRATAATEKVAAAEGLV